MKILRRIEKMKICIMKVIFLHSRVVKVKKGLLKLTRRGLNLSHILMLLLKMLLARI